jgi:hypothetical protein
MPPICYLYRVKIGKKGIMEGKMLLGDWGNLLRDGVIE